MKRSGSTIIFFIVCAVVLAAALGVGLVIRGVRTSGQAEPTVKAVAEPNRTGPGPARGERPGFGREGRDQMMSEAERTRLRAERASMLERMENMTEEERAQAREQMAQRFGGGRRGGGRSSELSDEERARMDEERRQMRERFENMTDEEREQFRQQMRERFAGRRGGLGGQRGDRGTGEEGGMRRPRGTDRPSQEAEEPVAEEPETQ
jgi:hypothetical protein